MIFYRSDAWRGIIFRYTGTIWPSIWRSFTGIVGYLAASYMYCEHTNSNLASIKGNVLGGVIVFLLVFRANQSYSRYWQGRTLVTEAFCELRGIIATALVLMPGGQRGYMWRWKASRIGRVTGDRSRQTADALEKHTDDFDRITSEERVDIVRWGIILAVSFQINARIADCLDRGVLPADVRRLVDWDRYRLRCLMSKAEFREMDGLVSGLAIPQAAWEDCLLMDPKAFLAELAETPGENADTEVSAEPSVRLPHVAAFQFLSVLLRNTNDSRIMDKRYGYAERFFATFSSRMMHLQQLVNKMTQIISTPLPFPYFHLCQTLLWLYFGFFPFFLDISLGVWANFGELSCLAAVLLGLDSIATELENPFGCDANDLAIGDDLFRLEKEALFCMRGTGDVHVEDSFLWLPMPEHMALRAAGAVDGYLVLKTQWETNGATPEVYPFKRGTRNIITDAECEAADESGDSDES